MSNALLASSVDFIRWFDEIGIDDVPLVGGKNASLGEMARELAPREVNLANGFAITAEAYRHFLQTTDLDVRIRDLLSGLDSQDVRTSAAWAANSPGHHGSRIARRFADGDCGSLRSFGGGFRRAARCGRA